MPVKSVHKLSPPDGKTVQQHLDSLQKRIKALGAAVAGQWLIEIESYASSSSNDKTPRSVNLVHNSEYPTLTFAITHNGVCLTSDRGLALLMLKMKPMLTPKKSNKCEVKGWRYSLSDFMIKFGSISVGPNLKGIAFEVEYTPCHSNEKCGAFLADVVREIMGDDLSTADITKSIFPSDGDRSIPEHMKGYCQLFTASGNRGDQKTSTTETEGDNK